MYIKTIDSGIQIHSGIQFSVASLSTLTMPWYLRKNTKATKGIIKNEWIQIRHMRIHELRNSNASYGGSYKQLQKTH